MSIEIRGQRADTLNREFAMARLQCAMEERIAAVVRPRPRPMSIRLMIASALRMIAAMADSK